MGTLIFFIRFIFFFKTFLHIKKNSILTANLQLIDTFATQNINTGLSYILILYDLRHHNYLICFTLIPLKNKNIFYFSNLISLENLFFNANWTERETAETTGIFFSNKVDSRNLLLEYTNIFKPLLKLYPTVGFFEIFFDIIRQHILHRDVSLQN